jgi:hypothetical protein
MIAQKKDYWIEQADIQVDTLHAWIARAEGRNDEAVKLMRAAADREDRTEEHVMMPGRVIPVREMLGELLLDLNRPIAALAAFEESQRGDPKRFRNTYGTARAAELAGKRDKAKVNYTRLLDQVGPDTGGRSEIEHARTFIAKLVADIRTGKYSNVHSLLVVRSGKLVTEEYFQGDDERRGQPLGNVRFDATTLHDLRSVSKSVTSALFGIAMSSGAIRDIDAPVLSYFPEYRDLQTPERLRIRLRDFRAR